MTTRWPLPLVLVLVGLATLGCKKPASPPPPPPPVQAAPSAATQPPPPPPAPTGPAAARTENVRGMKLYRAKDYAGAAAAFRQAIAADASHVFAHYNLACVLALTDDKAGAIRELEWMAQSADPKATRRLATAEEDADLAKLVSDEKVKALFKSAAERALFLGFTPLARGVEATPKQVDRLWKVWENDEIAKEGLALSYEVVPSSPGEETVVALPGAVGVFSASGKLLASGELTTDANNINHLYVGQVVPDAELEIVVHSTWSRGVSNTADLTVFKRRDDNLAQVLSAGLSSYFFKADEVQTSEDGITGTDDQASGDLELRPDGTLRHRSLGDKRARTLHWDAAAFKFVPTSAKAH